MLTVRLAGDLHKTQSHYSKLATFIYVKLAKKAIDECNKTECEWKWVLIWLSNFLLKIQLIFNEFRMFRFNLAKWHFDGDFDIDDLLAPLFWSFASLFITCEIGQKGIEETNKIECTINEYDWYEFSIEIRRILPIPIMAAQERCANIFGSKEVCRDTFGSVSLLNSITKKLSNLYMLQ